MADEADWLVERLARLLDAVRTASDDASTASAAVLDELVASLRADLAAVVASGAVVALAGPAAVRVTAGDVVAATTAGPGADVNGVGACDVALGELHQSGYDRVVVLRSQGTFSRRERSVVALAARALDLALHFDRSELVATLTKRDHLLDNLGRIERSISQRTPLGEVLATITDALSHMLGDEVALLRLLDPEDPGSLILVADSGVSPAEFDLISQTRVGEGAGGLAVSEDRLVVIEHYADDPRALAPFVARGLETAMAAPVHEGATVVGSLTVGTYQQGRVYSALDKETLLAFAEHVSLALTDAKTLEAMREAQRAKDNLLAMVSHELKTPLTVIMGVVQTMQRHAERLPDDMRDEMLASAQERGHELERLIDRLLQGARGEPSGASQETFLPALVAGAARPYDETQRIDVGPVPPYQVEVDTVAVQNALGKLLENAVSHSPEGSRVVVSTERTDDLVSVTVTNVGFLPSGVDVPTLFMPFQRGPGARAPGVGLGLFIAGRLAATLGGAIDVTTGDDTVSFTLTFPVRTALPSPGDARAPRRTAGRRRSAGPRR
jgi:signal transduction histidine kinase